jgi:Beta-lactamase class C and other penicillin binding proteins
LATAYARDYVSGELKVFDDPATGKYARPPVFENGSAGLVSTADDFNAFAQMLLNGGRLGSERILSRPSVELMTMDHLTPEQKLGSEIFLGDNRGWGLGLSVFTRRDSLGDAPGRFGWDGGYGTSWYSDPKEGLTGRFADPAHDGFAAAAGGAGGLLDARLSGDRRLSVAPATFPKSAMHLARWLIAPRPRGKLRK